MPISLLISNKTTSNLNMPSVGFFFIVHYLLVPIEIQELPKIIVYRDQRALKDNWRDFKRIEHIVSKGIFFFVFCWCGCFFFSFSKQIFVETLITYSSILILMWIVLIWVFTVNVFYRLFKGFSKYIVNMDWMFIGKEGYIDLDAIFNYIRKLFLPFLTTKFLYWNASSWFDVDPILFALSKKRRNYSSRMFRIESKQKIHWEEVRPIYGIQHQRWGIGSTWCIIECLLMHSISWLRNYLHSWNHSVLTQWGRN